MRTLFRNHVRGLVFASLCLAGGAIAYAAPNPPLSEQPVNGGDIKGTAVSCGAPVSGVFVYLPGRSFLAIVDDAGRFELNYVVPGTYALRFRSSTGQELGELPRVVVLKNRVTLLGAVTLPCADADGDGFDRTSDCNDSNAAIFPGAEEVCNGVDDNCDAAVDETCQSCTDGDGDGVCAPADCDDADASVSPNAAEICQDGIDNNCNAQVDDGCPACFNNADCQDGFFCSNPGATDAVCALKLADGEACTVSNQCQSSSCQDGVCAPIGN